MSKTIKQIAEDIGVSKPTVVKIISELGIEPRRIGNRFELSDDEIERVKTKISPNSKEDELQKTKILERNASQISQNNPEKTQNSINSILETQISILQGQLAAKDEQIKVMQQQITSKDEQIGQLTSALENTTAALTAAQALHAGTIQERLTDNSMAASEAEPVEEKKKGFFARLFGKK